MIVEMARVQIIGPKALLDECVKALHAAAVVHIETVPVSENPEGGQAVLARFPLEKERLARKESIGKAIEKVKGFISLLPPPLQWERVSVSASETDGLVEDVSLLEDKVRGFHAKRDKLREELSLVVKYEKLLKGFAPMVSRLGGLKNLDVMGLTLEKTREDILKLVEAEVGRITNGGYRLYAKEFDVNTFGIVLAYPRQFDAEIRLLLTGKAVSEVRLPEEYEEMTLFSALRRMSAKMEELPRQIDEAEAEIERVSKRWYGVLVGLIEAMEDSLDEIGVLDYAGQTRFAFVIEGWVPRDSLNKLRDGFSGIFGERVFIRELEVDGRDTARVPVCIRNPWFIRPFEVFLRALPIPVYGSVDPTVFVAVFFPAFYGLIVGDVAYGGILLALSLFLRRRFSNRAILRDMFTVLAVSSVSAIFFGVLYGEFFGDLGERLGILHPILLHRENSIKTLGVIVLGVGIGHVLLGIIIGVVNNLYRKRFREAWGRGAYFVVIVSFLALLGIMAGRLPEVFFMPGVVVLAASFIILTLLEGIIGPLEFLKAIGNILSYLRLMAVGMASVVLALVANRIGGLSENIIIGIFAAGILHALNLALSLLSPTIQSMRLQYVEFFSKFYEGGGREYHPFSKR